MLSGIRTGCSRLQRGAQNFTGAVGDRVTGIKSGITETVNKASQSFSNLTIAALFLEAGKVFFRLPIVDPIGGLIGVTLLAPVVNFCLGRNTTARNSPRKNLYDRLVQTERKALDPGYTGRRKQPYGGAFGKAHHLIKDAKDLGQEDAIIKADHVVSNEISRRRLKGRLAAAMQKDKDGAYFSVVRLEDEKGKINNNIIAVYQSELRNSGARNPDTIDLGKTLIMVKNPAAAEPGETPLIIPQTDKYEPTLFTQRNEFHRQTVKLSRNTLKSNHSIEKIVADYKNQRQKNEQLKRNLKGKETAFMLKKTEYQEKLQQAQNVIRPEPMALDELSTQLSGEITKAQDTLASLTVTSWDTLKTSEKVLRKIQKEFNLNNFTEGFKSTEGFKQVESIFSGLEDSWFGQEKRPETAPVLPVSQSAAGGAGTSHAEANNPPEPIDTRNDLLKLLGSWFAGRAAHG